jgi:hypothetical protein
VFIPMLILNELDFVKLISILARATLIGREFLKLYTYHIFISKFFREMLTSVSGHLALIKEL